MFHYDFNSLWLRKPSKMDKNIPLPHELGSEWAQRTKQCRASKIETSEMSHSLLCLLVCLHRSLICLLQTARFAHALCCVHLLSRSLAHCGAHGKRFVSELSASISYNLGPQCAMKDIQSAVCNGVVAYIFEVSVVAIGRLFSQISDGDWVFWSSAS